MSSKMKFAIALLSMLVLCAACSNEASVDTKTDVYHVITCSVILNCDEIIVNAKLENDKLLDIWYINDDEWTVATGNVEVIVNH